jgi:hypothetical protein
MVRVASDPHFREEGSGRNRLRDLLVPENAGDPRILQQTLHEARLCRIGGFEHFAHFRAA